MKTRTIITALVLAGILLAAQSVALYAQDKEIIRQERDLPDFTGIDVGGAFDVFLSQGAEQSVIVETESKNLDKIFTRVEGDILKVSSKSIRNARHLDLYITIKDLDLLFISGAADLKGQGPMVTGKLKINCSGASDLDLEIKATQVEITASGASDVNLKGTTNTLNVKASGASSVDCAGLGAMEVKADASGASSIHIEGSNAIATKTSGAGSITRHQKGKMVVVSKGPEDRDYVKVDSRNYGDTTRIKVGGVYVEVVEDDSVRVTVGNRVLIVNEDGDVKFCRHKKRKFNGHWGGFGLSINGFVNDDYNMDFPREEEYLDLRMEKSIGVYFNLYEQNIAFTRNNKFGLVTGLGIESHNYRFTDQTTLLTSSGRLEGYIDQGISVRKTKLVANYFVLPLILEWQNGHEKKWQRFHINGGVILKARFSSHTKKYYNELNKEYYLTQYDPVTDGYIPVFTNVSPGENKTHNKGDFYLNPFQLDATVGLGIGIVNIFSHFGVMPMFRDNRAPLLYTWSAGIILVGW
jgi:hypothetical protein